VIGDHQVLLIPDPDVQAWGPDLASNPDMTTDLAGWVPGPFQPAWKWEAGWAVPVNTADAPGWLRRDRTAPIARGAATQYRIQTRVRTHYPVWVIPEVTFGTTPEAVEVGTFWMPDDAIAKGQWLWCPAAGTYQFEILVDPTDVPAAYAYVGPSVAVFAPEGSGGHWFDIDYLHLHGQGLVSFDITCLVDRVAIHHGREDADSQPEAAAATLELSADHDADEWLPTDLEVGGIIRVLTTLASTGDSVRFVGRITDLDMGWEDAGADTPDRVQARIMASGALADLGRRVVGDAPWPQELDGARVARVMAAAGVTLDPIVSDPGTVQVLARDVDSQAALAVAQGTAESAGGLVWHTRSGEVRYADADHRRGAAASLELDACDILVTPTWRRSTEGLLNLVSIGYGVAPEGGEQPRYVADRPDSVAKYGRYELSATTELAAAADAEAMGNLLLTRNSEPVWVMAELPVDVKNLDADQTTKLLGLDMHALVALTGLPLAGSAPTTATLWVEGWTEELGWGEHALTLTVTGYCRTAPPPRWDDLLPDRTWDTTPGSLTWDSLACLGPQPGQGRWADVPATLRWDTITPTTVTWDTWEDHY
jgi:hypothetical protein